MVDVAIHVEAMVAVAEDADADADVAAGADRHGSNSGSNSERPTCQLCGKKGHTVIRCYKRFDASFQGPSEKSVSAATTSSYNIDTNWYTDTGASDHVTGELVKLTMRDRYQGGD